MGMNMARPRKDRLQDSVQERIKATFWQLLRERSVSQITVSEIVRVVGCNRNTFYYHFDSVEDLTSHAIAEAIPVEIPVLAEAYFAGALIDMPLDKEARRSIERLCLLVGRGGSPAAAEQVKEALKAVWIERFNMDNTQEDVACVLEFMASGIVGMLGFWASHNDEVPLDRCFHAVSSVFSKPAVAFAQGRSIRNAAVE
ncbi:hypothetical protein EGYY_16100 [Eggerthella sp. YY7918]|nr:hypothetical protein EGYY_16100 [Eggerthella sp. YY7918]